MCFLKFVIVLMSICHVLVNAATFDVGHDIENQQASEFHQIIDDREHITEELNGIYTEQQIEEMIPGERAFTWFQAHDSDVDGFLDGLEVYKAIHHAIQHNAGLQSANIEEAFKTGAEDQAAIDLVDELIEHYDADNDGVLDFPEFITSYKDTEKRLNM